MAVKKHRIPADGAGGPAPGREPDHSAQVAELDIVGQSFEIDTTIARLAADGVEVVRSSPLGALPQLGNLGHNAQHKLVFREVDREAVVGALRAAGLY